MYTHACTHIHTCRPQQRGAKSPWYMYTFMYMYNVHECTCIQTDNCMFSSFEASSVQSYNHVHIHVHVHTKYTAAIHVHVLHAQLLYHEPTVHIHCSYCTCTMCVHMLIRHSICVHVTVHVTVHVLYVHTMHTFPISSSCLTWSS